MTCFEGGREDGWKGGERMDGRGVREWTEGVRENGWKGCESVNRTNTDRVTLPTVPSVSSGYLVPHVRLSQRNSFQIQG